MLFWSDCFSRGLPSAVVGTSYLLLQYLKIHRFGSSNSGPSGPSGRSAVRCPRGPNTCCMSRYIDAIRTRRR